MDGSRFDTLARSLSASRRASLFAILGGALGLAAFGAEEAAAGCKKLGKKCDKNKDCCDGATCKGDNKKKKGKCRCQSGLEDCDGDGACESLDADDANCGACGNACEEDQFCSDSECQTCVPTTPPFSPAAGTCSSDRECCGDSLCCTFNDESLCIDVRTNPFTCGLTCDNVDNCFLADQICVNGACVNPLP